MLKAIFLDMDETLCDTTLANRKALDCMAERVGEIFGGAVDQNEVAARYLKGIYRDLDERYRTLLFPVTHEASFRIALIELILSDLGVETVPEGAAQDLQNTFDEARTRFFDFFPGVKEQLIAWRESYTLVVITNGPEFSQVVKVERVALQDYVDHIIIGGQEKEEKPAPSIFAKAMRLANCGAEGAVHVGDSLSADIQGANNAGIRSIWISHGESLGATSAKPDHVVEAPMQAMELINRLANLTR